MSRSTRLLPLLVVLLALPGPFPAEAAEAASVAGNKLLFTRQIDRQDDLWSVTLDGSGRPGAPRRITDHRAKDSHGAPSPDGHWIVFNSERAGWWKIWRMDADGGDIRQLTDPSGADYYPDWSPDGRWIVYASGDHGNGDILIMPADGPRESQTRNVSKHRGRDNFPSWSPDGTWIVYSSDRGDSWGLYVTDPRGEVTRKLVTEGNALEPAWFPDARTVVYQSDADGESWNLWIASLDDDVAPRRLTDHPGNEKRPAVSPDGRWIAFETDRDGGSQIYIVAADGSDARRITDEGYNYGPRWFAGPND